MPDEKSKEVFQTEDLALCAYLQMKGIMMLNYENNNHRINFILNDEKGICKNLHIEFLNSECKKFDSFVRDLKKLFR